MMYCTYGKTVDCVGECLYKIAEHTSAVIDMQNKIVVVLQSRKVVSTHLMFP